MSGENGPREQMNRRECLVARDRSEIWLDGVKYVPADVVELRGGWPSEVIKTKYVS